MSHWEASGKSDEWYTPKYIFDALECEFDIDVASPSTRWHVPARCWLTAQDDGLKYAPFWHGVVWMNPPFGGRNGLVPWLNAFRRHENGIALVPDRTSAPWWQEMADCADRILFIGGKVRFIKPDGTTGDSPSVGTTLIGMGRRAVIALEKAERNGLGRTFTRSIA
ncbi:DNA N-6-adenine-methyltransferase [Sinorhizobium meliloti]|uniref:DNA N-6-adenine-methyltransferase n=1 Tax=Rhizobium meliloti TaxID=382 RepID=UPI0001E4D7E6|nr:DNA N-6-adenine-methyltransferase [Sinorhizobium meliloti]AEG04258.1 DNA N-6-adenine-methyltransferase [Sinorhizobium meliloti BL225C]MDE4545199.1 phage N-6-adenine-methyltransferase [Sinorhizobium meliloti]MDE4573778.1 phage N-6-adenine-methyltransferase [Sinorhizobium meliloti]SDY98783.1 phage N-6-adenine-methyltransferase [Sinorhizobium meliloti]